MTLDKWLEIERSFDRSSLRVHQFYDSMQQIGIIKLMPSTYHEVIVGMFKSILPAVLAPAGVNILDFVHMGATHRVNPTARARNPMLRGGQ
jgi:hypothetical protein